MAAQEKTHTSGRDDNPCLRGAKPVRGARGVMYKQTSGYLERSMLG